MSHASSTNGSSRVRRAVSEVKRVLQVSTLQLSKALSNSTTTLGKHDAARYFISPSFNGSNWSQALTVTKHFKKDCARYADLRLLDAPISQQRSVQSSATIQVTLRTTVRSTTSSTRFLLAVELTLSFKISRDRSLYPAYEVEDGIVKSSYSLLMGE
jgi:hypothetical protein